MLVNPLALIGACFVLAGVCFLLGFAVGFYVNKLTRF